MPYNDPLRPEPPPFRPPEPQPYRAPDWHPSDRPPFEPPRTPNPVDPTRNPWQPGVIGIISGAVAFLFVCIAATAAYAANAGGGGGMPWDAPLTALQTDLTGSTATAISLIGIVAVFGVLIFGGELNHFFRTLCYIILLVSVLVAGQNILSSLGIAGATVDNETGYHVYGFISGVIVSSLIWGFGIFLHRRWRAAQLRAVEPASAATLSTMARLPD